MKKGTVLKTAFLPLLAAALLGAGQGEGCGDMMGFGDEGGWGSHHCCGGWWNGDEPSPGPEPGSPPGETTPPGDQTGEACSLFLALVDADADYTSDLFLAGEPDRLLFEDTSSNPGAVAELPWTAGEEPLFFIMVHAGDTVYPVYSDGEWAVWDQVSEAAWLLGFEDIPDPASSDFDYNDVVVAVELVDCGTIEPGIPAETIIVPEPGARKVHVNFLEATFRAGDLYLEADPWELLIAKGATGKGASARNFFPPGEELVFILDTGESLFYSTDPGAARIQRITDFNYRINYDLDGDGSFGEAVVHVVITPAGQ